MKRVRFQWGLIIIPRVVLFWFSGRSGPGRVIVEDDSGMIVIDAFAKTRSRPAGDDITHTS